MTDVATNKGPLWLAVEGKILDLTDSDLSTGNQELTVQRLAAELDSSGYNLSRHAGNLLQLRAAVGARIKAGRPLLQTFNDATAALTLEDVTNPLKTAVTIACDLGETWPAIKSYDRRSDIVKIVERTRLDLLVARAKSLADDQGIRFLIGEGVVSETIMDALGIGQDKLAEVHAAIEAESAAIARVEKLIEAVTDKSQAEKAEHLVNNDVPDKLIVELAGIDQSVIDGVRQAMEEALREKQRLAEEAAARKKAEAEGPSLEDIPPDEMVEHIEAIQEIMEFSDQADEIRTMCEQSSIPRCLVDIAITDPDRLEALLEEAEG